MRITIDHTMTLVAPAGTSLAVFHLLLTPPSGPGQKVESWSVEMAGIGNAGRFTDGFGNTAHLVNQAKPEGDIVVQVRGEVTTRDTSGILGRPLGEPVPALYRRLTELTKAPSDLYEPFRGSKETRLNILHALMRQVGETLGLPEDDDEAEEPAVETQMQADGGQSQSQSAAAEPKTEDETPDEVDAVVRPLATDYAHLFIGAARALGIPARFVIGYRLADDETVSALHAWAEAFDDGLGWIGFDAYEQICSTENYVRLAMGLDAESALPLRTVPVVEIVHEVILKAAPADAE